MKRRLVFSFLLMFLLLPLGLRGAVAQTEAQTLNLSTDLVSKGIAKTNMLPNMPQQDSASPLNAALSYVALNPGSYTRLIADPGDYYFLMPAGGTQRGNPVYVTVQNLNGVTLDFHGANLLFTQPALSAFYINNCTGCFFRDFTIDYAILPFTQLTVTEIHPKVQRIVGVVQPYLVPTRSYQNPRHLYCSQSQKVPPKDFFFNGFDTRKGVPQTAPGRWTVSPPARPCDTTTETAAEAAGQVILQLNADVTSIQAGDVFVVSARGGGPAVWIQDSPGATFQSVSIYTSSGAAIEASNSADLSILGVAVVPRPGTNRLASTVAGGIELNGVGPNNRVQNSTVIGAQDDSIAGNTTTLGVVKALSGNSVTYTPASNQPIAQGTVLFFTAQATGLPVGEGPLGTQFTVQSSTTNSVTITPTPTPGQASSFTNASMFNAVRGNGLTITNNLVQNSFLARGIALQGISGATIGYNTIISTQQAGIAVDNSLADGFGPNYDVLIEHNLVANANGGLAGIGSEMFGAIQALSLNGIANGDWVQGSPSHRILINDNQIIGTLRTGIWVGNVATGVISNNTLTNTNLNPAIASPNHLPTGISCELAEQSFVQPIFTISSGVSLKDNSTGPPVSPIPCSP